MISIVDQTLIITEQKLSEMELKKFSKNSFLEEKNIKGEKTFKKSILVSEMK
jgi:hypothetical protein